MNIFITEKDGTSISIEFDSGKPDDVAFVEELLDGYEYEECECECGCCEEPDTIAFGIEIDKAKVSDWTQEAVDGVMEKIKQEIQMQLKDAGMQR